MRRKVLLLKHVLEEAQTDALPLERLVHVKVEDTTWFDLGHGTSRDVKLLVTCFE